MNQRITAARVEANAISGWLLVAIGSLKHGEERTDGKQELSAELTGDAIAEARAALNRFEDICTSRRPGVIDE